MSVLIEAVTLVVRRRRFDSVYPGGADEFIGAALAFSPVPRYGCADDPHLLGLSFEHPDHAVHAISLLQAAGLKGFAETIPDLVDFAFVDASSGPASRIAWLGFDKHEDGFSFAWDVAEPVGAVAGPAEWARQRPRDNDRSILEADADQLMLLASENGVRTYLDLRTGALTNKDATPVPPTRPPGGPTRNGRFGRDASDDDDFDYDTPLGGRLSRLLSYALYQLGWKTLSNGPKLYVVEYSGALTTYFCRYVANDSSNSISCSICAPLNIPVKQRRKVLEYISRLNCRCTLGGFDLDLDSGALSFRAAFALGDEIPTPTMAAHIAMVGVGMIDCYFPRVMEIVTGSRSVLDAAAASLEGSDDSNSSSTI